jgi:hypothetical protein
MSKAVALLLILITLTVTSTTIAKPELSSDETKENRGISKITGRF